MTNSKRPSEYAFGAFPIYVESGCGVKVVDVDEISEALKTSKKDS